MSETAHGSAGATEVVYDEAGSVALSNPMTPPEAESDGMAPPSAASPDDIAPPAGEGGGDADL